MSFWRSWPFLGLVFMLGLSSCGSSNDDRPTEAPVAQPVSGSVEEAVNQVAQGKFVDDCFRGTEAKLREMARALDSRTTEIRELSQRLAEKNRSHRLIRLGPIVAVEPMEREAPASRWLRVEYDWTMAYEFFKRIEKKTVDADWIELNSVVRQMLSSESVRLVDGWDFADGRNSVPYLKSVLEKIDRCYQDRNCFFPELSESDRAYILRPGYFTNAYRELQKTSSRTERRKWIDLLRKIVIGRLQSREGFRVNPEMRQVAPGQFEVKVDAGDLESAKTELASIVESFWQDSVHSIAILWESKRDGLYRILADMVAGSRAYVHHGEKTMHLYSGVRTAVIAHEFGHIFGFVDYYYETWNAETCRYQSEWDSGDLMSNSSGRAVPPTHWELLPNS